MRLQDYLKDRGMPVAEFGRRVGVTNRQTMARYARGERIPPKDVMTKIIAVTDGKVQPNDFFDAPAQAAD